MSCEMIQVYFSNSWVYELYSDVPSSEPNDAAWTSAVFTGGVWGWPGKGKCVFDTKYQNFPFCLLTFFISVIFPEQMENNGSC